MCHHVVMCSPLAHCRYSSSLRDVSHTFMDTTSTSDTTSIEATQYSREVLKLLLQDTPTNGCAKTARALIESLDSRPNPNKFALADTSDTRRVSMPFSPQ